MTSIMNVTLQFWLTFYVSLSSKGLGFFGSDVPPTFRLDSWDVTSQKVHAVFFATFCLCLCFVPFYIFHAKTVKTSIFLPAFGVRSTQTLGEKYNSEKYQNIGEKTYYYDNLKYLNIFVRRLLKASPLIPQTYISRYYNIDLTEGS